MQAEAPANRFSIPLNLQGEKLADKLHELSAQGHRPLNYKGTWSMLQHADQDPANKNNIVTLYSRKSLPKNCKTGSQTKNCLERWNREHVWAKSHGFPKPSQWAYTDGHHLRAEIEYCNSLRSDFDFAEGGRFFERCSSKRSTGKLKTWEPANESKGEVARMMFYMAVRYNGGVLDKTPDLRLVDRNTRNGEPVFGKLCILLKWNKMYPVSSRERQRNEIVQSYQGNRNPFVDEPEFAQKIWGLQCPEPRKGSVE